MVSMKRTLYALLAAALLFSMAACGAGSADTATEKVNTKPVVVTTLFPAYDFARTIAGELCDTVIGYLNLYFKRGDCASAEAILRLGIGFFSCLRITSTFGLVTGCFATKIVQQSSYGRIDVS